MPSERLTLQQMCARFNVTPRTLRHYEYIELLAPERSGRSRLYGSREFARMELILRGRRFGFALEEIRKWLLLRDADTSNRIQMETWIEGAGLQIEELKKRRCELDETIDDLSALRQLSIDALSK